jgi:hypothetical protein
MVPPCPSGMVKFQTFALSVSCPDPNVNVSKKLAVAARKEK